MLKSRLSTGELVEKLVPRGEVDNPGAPFFLAENRSTPEAKDSPCFQAEKATAGGGDRNRGQNRVTGNG